MLISDYFEQTVSSHQIRKNVTWQFYWSQKYPQSLHK